jgi:carbon storage regulator
MLTAWEGGPALCNEGCHRSSDTFKNTKKRVARLRAIDYQRRSNHPGARLISFCHFSYINGIFVAFIWSANCCHGGGDSTYPLKDEKAMLVLTRKIGEEINIDGRIRVTVTGIKGDKVRIGVDAPPDVRVDREVVHRRRCEFAEPEPSAMAQ